MTAPTGAPTGRDAAVAGGEGLEELTKSLLPVIAAVQAEGKTGMAAAIEIARRLDYGKIIGKTGAHLAAKKIAEAIANAGGITDPTTKFGTILIVENLLAGAAVAGVDQIGANLADPAKFGTHFKAAVAKVVPTTATPAGGIIAVTWESGEGSDLVHRARVDASGAVVPFPGRGFAQPCCGRMGQALALHDMRHPTQTRGGGKDKGGNPIPRETVNKVEFIVQTTDVPTAFAAKKVPCPDCFPNITFLAPAAAPKGKTFWEKSDESEACMDVWAAVIHASGPTSTLRKHVVVDHLEDVPSKVEFTAFRIACERFHPRVTKVTDPADATRVLFVEMSDEDVLEFLRWLDSIGTELKLVNKTSEAAHNAFETAKHALEHGGPAAWGIAALAIIVPLAYIAVAFPIVGMYGAGVFGWWQNQAWNIGLTFGGALLALLWLIPWYTMTGIGKFFGGLIHSHPDDHGNPSLANTARNITALLFGLGVTTMLICSVGILFGFETYSIRLVAVPVIALALIAYDRIGARWGHESEEIHHLLEKLSFNNIRTLAFVATALALIGIGPLAYSQYVEANTTFKLAVEQKTVEGEAVFYVPTPDGKVFRPADLFGWTKAKEITEGMGTGAHEEVCLPVGTSVDLPGYTEKAAGECELENGAKGVSYAIRANPLGIKLGGVEAYDTLEALFLASHREEADLQAVVKAELAPTPPPAQATPTPEPKATVNAVPPAAASTPPKAKAKVDCSKLSPRARSKQQGC